jgi:hypothetical protein
MTRHLLAVLILSSCSPTFPGEISGQDPRGKADTGWVARDSFEVECVLNGKVQHRAIGEFAELATSRALQEQLIDSQVKFGKTQMKAAHYHLNQHVHQIRKISAAVEGELVTLSYEISVDMIHQKGTSDPVPTLESLEPRSFELLLPLDPIEAYATAGLKCFSDSCDCPMEDRNYFYCFQGDKEGCDAALPLAKTELKLTRVYPPARTPYPEYDRLLTSLGDDLQGFRVALLPTLGDDEDHYTFDPIKRALDGLGLVGELSKDKTYYRYLWTRNAATIVIDLYDPAVLGNSTAFIDAFHRALGDYEMIFYGGHSQYGTRPLLSEKSWYNDRYQIVMMESCRSYAYYIRQVFRAKATDEDPSGFANADVIATGVPSTFGNVMKLIVPILSKLMDGIDAVSAGKPEQAPSWLEILDMIGGLDWADAWHGVAGARTNSWQPDQP